MEQFWHHYNFPAFVSSQKTIHDVKKRDETIQDRSIFFSLFLAIIFFSPSFRSNPPIGSASITYLEYPNTTKSKKCSNPLFSAFSTVLSVLLTKGSSFPIPWVTVKISYRTLAKSSCYLDDRTLIQNKTTFCRYFCLKLLRRAFLRN